MILCGLFVDYEFKFCRLRDRQIGWFLALENSAGVCAEQAVVFRFTAAIAHQASGGDEPARFVYGGQRMANGQRGELFARREDDRAHIHGTHVPVEEPSTVSTAELSRIDAPDAHMVAPEIK